MSKNNINIIGLFSLRIRYIGLLLVVISSIALTINYLISNPFISPSKVLWFIALLLSTVNFSFLGKDLKRDRLSRYLALKASLSLTIGFLMAISFMQVYLGRDLGEISLFTVLFVNIIFMSIHYTLYYFVINEETVVGNESISAFFSDQYKMIFLLLLLSAFTLILIFLL